MWRPGTAGTAAFLFVERCTCPAEGRTAATAAAGATSSLSPTPNCATCSPSPTRSTSRPARAGPAQGARKHGADGETVLIPVPLGTQVWAEADDTETDERLLADVTHPGQRDPRGSRRRRGSRQRPLHQLGAPGSQVRRIGRGGESLWLQLTLSSWPTPGWPGCPTRASLPCLRRLSNAKPKVADYPFTTLEPMLGVVDWSGEGDVFILADVPGLLEGASEGVGLGHEFLAHLERCQLLLHVVDVTGYYGVDPLEGFRIILRELDAHAARSGGATPGGACSTRSTPCLPRWSRSRPRSSSTEIERLRSAGHPAFAYLVGEDELPPSSSSSGPCRRRPGRGSSALAPLDRAASAASSQPGDRNSPRVRRQSAVETARASAA